MIISSSNPAGEFTEVAEPGHAGADLVMGSFIKNPGVWYSLYIAMSLVLVI
jgi:cystathionine beta-lyase family protein involved in aluminum resistance